jgi:hypothetical protein
MDNTLELDLEAIQARCAVATAGPWKADRGSIVSDTELIAVGGDEMGAQFNTADAEFTAHAREDVPALHAEVLRLRAQVAALTNTEDVEA